MLVTTALIISAAGFFARGGFATPSAGRETRKPLVFWTMLRRSGGADAGLLGGDLFNLYVALELLTFAAVPLVCLDGRAGTLAAALRYLLFALFGSVLYLLGVALLYGAYGTLDIALLAEPMRRTGRLDGGRADDGGAAGQDRAFPAASLAASGPCQRAGRGQRRAVGARGQRLVLPRRAAVVRRPAGAAGRGSERDLGALGSAAILFGSVLALRQARLKLLIAYSTIAQIGYLFLFFPLAAGATPGRRTAWNGGVMQACRPRLRQGGDVPRRRPDRRGRSGMTGSPTSAARPGDAADVPYARPWRPVADGAAAERRLRREMAAAQRLDRGGTMGVGLVMLAGGLLAARLRLSDAGPGARGHGPAEQAPAAAGGRSGRACARRSSLSLLAFAPQSFFAFSQIGRPAGSAAWRAAHDAVGSASWS